MQEIPVESIPSYIKILLSISGTIIVIMAGIVGWFIRRNYNQRDDDKSNLVDLTKKLEDSIITLDKTVVKLSENVMAQFEICKLKHEPIEKRLTEGDRTLKDHAKRIHDLELRLSKINGQ
jgi:uncharacterized Fe-S cluster-containing protein